MATTNQKVMKPDKDMAATNQKVMKPNRDMATTNQNGMKPDRNMATASSLAPDSYPKITTLTPIEQLLADKRSIEAKCSIREKKLHEDFNYIHNNSSALIFSGLVSLLFSSGQTEKKPESQSITLVDDNQSPRSNNLLSSSNIFFVAQKMIPVVWEIIQPLLINWGIKKAKSLLLGLFTKKKSPPSAK